MVQLQMAGPAERHQVLFVVPPALRDWEDVVHFPHQRYAAFRQALLAERVLSGVVVSDPFPGAAVFLVDVRRALKAVVLPIHYYFVLFAVPFFCEPRASGVTAGALWFSGHFLLFFRVSLTL